MRSRRVLCMCAVALAAAVAAWPQSERRAALVIGNGAYRNLTPLENPVNDARDMAAALGRLGFQARLLTDAGLPEMEQALVDFAHSLSGDPAATGIFYYAGHGVQQAGVNYLIPADADVQTESMLKYKSLSLGLVLDSLSEARNRFNLIILDACRDNPFAGFRSASRGLAIVGQQPAGSAVVYATAAGQTAADGDGRNGIFTGVLLRHLERPGLEMGALLNTVGKEVQGITRGAQSPAVYRQYFDTYYVAGGAGSAQGAVSPQPAATLEKGNADLVVTTEPDGAEVTVNGASVGKSPVLAKDLPSGVPLRVEARKANSSASREITLKARDTAELSLVLEVERGNLFIRSTEKAVEVWIDGVRQGPLGSGLVKGVAAGERVVELRAEGLYWTGTVTVSRDDTAQLETTPFAVGRIAYDVPSGASARIEGAGYSRAVTGGGALDNVPVGSYTVAASGADYAEERVQLAVQRARETRYEAYRFGSLVVSGTPRGAEVYLDGVRTGALPASLAEVPAGAHTVAVKADGFGDESQTVIVRRGRKVEVPFALAKPLRVHEPVAAGANHSVLLKPDGTVWAWGWNSSGQLGDGTTVQRSSPTRVSGLAGVIAVAAGSYHTVVLKADGTVWAWGVNCSGQLGDGTTTNRSVPVQVSGLTGVLAVAAGSAHTLAVKSDGTVWAWGWNSSGQLGDGTKINRLAPVRVGELDGARAAAAGSEYGVALKGDGTLWAWGSNTYGQLGDGSGANRKTPVQVSGLRGMRAVFAGSSVSAAVAEEGTVWSWGWDGYAQLCLGTVAQRLTPTPVVWSP